MILEVIEVKIVVLILKRITEYMIKIAIFAIMYAITIKLFFMIGINNVIVNCMVLGMYTYIFFFKLISFC